MGLISVSLPSDGDTIDAADYNTPITTVVNAINGGLDNSNIAAGAAIDASKLADASITNSKLSTTTGELGGAWQSWTPTWTNLSVGNGTVTARYIKIGKTVHFSLKLLWGSTTSASGVFTFTLPVTAQSAYSADLEMICGAILRDASGFGINGLLYFASTTTARVAYWDGTNQVGNTSGTAPFIWTTSDYVFCIGSYEAA